jgi:hypothetical protein
MCALKQVRPRKATESAGPYRQKSEELHYPADKEHLCSIRQIRSRIPVGCGGFVKKKHGPSAQVRGASPFDNLMTLGGRPTAPPSGQRSIIANANYPATPSAVAHCRSGDCFASLQRQLSGNVIARSADTWCTDRYVRCRGRAYPARQEGRSKQRPYIGTKIRTFKSIST